MNHIFRNPKLTNVFRTLRPWIIFIGVFFLLKVTGIDRQISSATQHVLLKAGVLDIRFETDEVREQSFDYDFVLRDLQGNKVDMNTLKGKVIFINLWATWCGPCRVEMPSIQNLYNSVDRDHIAFVMLSLDESDKQAKVSKYIHSKELTFPVYQPVGALPKLLRVPSIPATFIVGKDGKVKYKKSGLANYDTDEMRALLAELAEGR